MTCYTSCFPKKVKTDGKIDCQEELETSKRISTKCFFDETSMGYALTDLHQIKKECELTTCDQGQYLCYWYNYCISIELICDGIHHCYFGDDEYNCGTFFLLFVFHLNKNNLLKKKNQKIPSIQLDILNVKMRNVSLSLIKEFAMESLIVFTGVMNFCATYRL